MSKTTWIDELKYILIPECEDYREKYVYDVPRLGKYIFEDGTEYLGEHQPLILNKLTKKELLEVMRRKTKRPLFYSNTSYAVNAVRIHCGKKLEVNQIFKIECDDFNMRTDLDEYILIPIRKVWSK